MSRTAYGDHFGQLPNHHGARADNRPATHPEIFDNDGVRTDERAGSYRHVATKVRSGSNLDIILQNAVVVHGRRCIDDRMSADLGPRLHDRTSKNHRAFAQRDG